MLQCNHLTLKGIRCTRKATDNNLCTQHKNIVSSKLQHGGAIKPDEVFSKYKDQINSRFKRERLTVSDQLPQGFIEADPSNKKLYLNWIVDSYVNGGIARFEDMGRTYDALKNFEYLKKKNVLQTHEKDINNFCGLRGCTVIKKNKLGIEISQKIKDGLDNLILKYKNEIDKIIEKINVTLDQPVYMGEKITIYNPKNKAQAQYYGSGTHWCTASKSSRNLFDKYNDLGPLFVIMPNNPTYAGEKYQMHKETRQIMNEMDKHIGVADLFDKYPELHDFFNKDDWAIEVAIGDNIRIVMYGEEYNDYELQFKDIMIKNTNFIDLFNMIPSKEFALAVLSLNVTLPQEMELHYINEMIHIIKIHYSKFLDTGADYFVPIDLFKL